MGTVIKSSSVSINGAFSAIEITQRAASQCIAKAGIDKNEINLLIYTGVYRDDNIAEPAMAPLVQKRLGMNLDPVNRGSLDRTTFSFDINNGECGFLSAVSVADAAFRAGSAKYALILSGDAHPSKRYHPDFPYALVGSAVLLAYEPERESGFRDVLVKTNGIEKTGLTSILHYKEFGVKGREMSRIDMEEDYHEELYKIAVEAIREYCTADSVKLSDIDVLLTSQQYAGLGGRISRSIGLNETSRVVDMHDLYGDPHTSALPLGYHHLSERGELIKNERILFVAAGSGLTASCSMYVV